MDLIIYFGLTCANEVDLVKFYPYPKNVRNTIIVDDANFLQSYQF